MPALIRKTQRLPGRELLADHVVVGLQGSVEAALVQGGDALFLAATNLQPAAVQALLAAAVGVTIFPADGLGVVTIGGPALSISGTPVLTAVVGTAYAGFAAVASGGTAPYTYSIAGGALPAGLALNTSSGAVSGTPSAAGTSSGIVIRATDAVAATADLAAFAIVVSAAGTAPVNTVLPAITGTAQDGQTLSVTNGTWTGTPTITYARQWRRAGTAISGATGTTYLCVTADVGSAITCTVTATNGSGSASATSAATAVVIAAGGGGASTAARYGVGAATAGVTTPAALLASMTAMAGGSNGSLVGSFTVAPGAGQYGWAAFLSSASASGVTFTDSLGTGGWQGASSAGNNFADDGSSPNTSVVTYSDGTTTWRFFRQSYAAAGGSFTTA